MNSNRGKKYEVNRDMKKTSKMIERTNQYRK